MTGPRSVRGGANRQTALLCSLPAWPGCWTCVRAPWRCWRWTRTACQWCCPLRPPTVQRWPGHWRNSASQTAGWEWTKTKRPGEKQDHAHPTALWAGALEHTAQTWANYRQRQRDVSKIINHNNTQWFYALAIGCQMFLGWVFMNALKSVKGLSLLPALLLSSILLLCIYLLCYGSSFCLFLFVLLWGSKYQNCFTLLK